MKWIEILSYQIQVLQEQIVTLPSGLVSDDGWL